MAFTLEQVEALEKAIAEGVLTVKYQDRLITYQSTDAMLKALSVMRQSLGLTSSNRKKAVFNKGLDE